ncbi:MAG: HAD family hydrolase [Rubrivivax sp.]
MAAAAGLARRGVLVQRLDAIEALAKARQVFFDKTGTLTEDRIVLREVKGLDPALDVRAVAASLAAWSQHPLSRAIAAGAAPSGLGWQAVEELPGQGVRALDDQGREWRLGRAAWAGATDDGEHAVWLARAGTPVGAFAFDEVLRDGAADTVAALRAEGVAVALLSGDEGARVQRLATRLGIADVVGGATPEGKLAALQQAQARAAGGDGGRWHQRRPRARARRRVGRDGQARSSRVRRPTWWWCRTACTTSRSRARRRSRRCASCTRTWPGPRSTTRPAFSPRCSAGCRPGPRAWAWPAVRWPWC